MPLPAALSRALCNRLTACVKENDLLRPDGKTQVSVEFDDQGTMEEPAKKIYSSKQEVLERVKEIARSAEAPVKEELDLLKTVFYKLHLAERDAQMKEYLAKGGDPEKYVLLPDDTEEAFKAEMQIIKEKRAKIFLAQEEEKQENLAKKLEIIEKIKAMTTSPEEVNKSYQDFKALLCKGNQRVKAPTRSGL